MALRNVVTLRCLAQRGLEGRGLLGQADFECCDAA